MNSAQAISKVGGAREGAGRKRRGDWQEAFLKSYAVQGGVYRCAARVGVAPRVVYEEQARNSAFAERMHEAREMYADSLEIDLVAQAKETGNPVGYIVRLKALRPNQYVEKHMMLSVNVDVDVPRDQAERFLSEMLANLTPATQQAISTGRDAFTDGRVAPATMPVILEVEP